MKVTATINDVDDSLERVEISQHDPITGQSIPREWLTLYDDSSDNVVYLYSDLDAIIDALKLAKEKWEQSK